MRRCAISIVLCLTLCACSATTGSSTRHSFSNASYINPEAGLWLAPQQRELVTCGEGRLLSCSNGSGRLSKAWCKCVGAWEHEMNAVDF